MKYCEKCGAANSDDALFCANCGNRMAQPAAEPVAQPVEEPSVNGYTENTSTEGRYQETAYSEPTYNGSAKSEETVAEPAVVPTGNASKTWLIVNIILTVIGCCCTGWCGSIASIIGIIIAAQGNGAFKDGDYASAESKAKTAKILGIVAIVLTVISLVVSIILYATGTFMSIMDEMGLN